MGINNQAPIRENSSTLIYSYLSFVQRGAKTRITIDVVSVPPKFVQNHFYAIVFVSLNLKTGTLLVDICSNLLLLTHISTVLEYSNTSKSSVFPCEARKYFEVKLTH